VLAGIDWTQLGLVGTFAAGVLVGAVITLRLGRIVVEYFKSQQHRDDD
jgi:hypothetical protein